MHPGLINAGIILYAMLFGFGFVAMKHLVAYVDPKVIVFFRIFITLLFLLPLAWRRWPKEKIPPSHWARLILGSLSGVVLSQLLFVYGLTKTTASHASIIFGLIPILTLVYARWFRAETFSFRRLGGFLISLTGIAYLMEIETFSWHEVSHVGDFIILINANGVAFYLVVVRPLSRYYSTFWTTACIFTVGLICVAPVSLVSLGQQSWTSLPASAWFCFVYVTVGATAAAYLLGMWLLRFTSSSHVSQSVYIQTLLAISAASYFLGEALSARLLVSTGLVFVGLALAQDILWKSWIKKVRARA